MSVTRTIIMRALFYTIYILLRVLPRKLQEKLAELLGWFFFKVLPGQKELMLSNLKRAFKDEYSQEELERIALRSQQNMIKSVFEFARFPLYSEKDLERMVEVPPESVENMRKASEAGKGIVLASAHFGNWEFLAWRIGSLGYQMTVVGRDQEDNLINDFIVKRRTSKGTKNVPRGVPMYEHMTNLLAKNELVGLVSDQNAGPRGLFVDFFGSKVSAFKGPGMFAVRTGARIVPVFIERLGYEKHRAYLCPAVEIEPTGDAGKDVLAFTQAYTTVIEDFVRRFPDHWFWIHKRWKTSPPGEEE